VELEAYRRSAEEFVSELTGEFYRHYAGLKEAYEIEPIYARHAELFEAGAVVELRELLAAAPAGSEARRRLTLLLDFALEGHLGEATKAAEAELARRDAALTIELDGGERLGFRESAVAQANEADAGRRAAIEHGRLEATDTHLNELYKEVIGTQHARARGLGYGSYREMCAESKGLDLTALNDETTAFTEKSEAKYPAVVDPALHASLGFGLERFARSDIPRFFRAPELDGLFPSAQLLGSFEATMRGLGIDVRAQAGVILDIEPRRNKIPRAFCAPVRAPGEVYLVLAPTGGHEDYSVLFHEGGHTEHYASVAPELPFEFRMLGDNSVTETFAFLFQHLVENPVWLERRLGVSDPAPVAAHGRAQRLTTPSSPEHFAPNRNRAVDRGAKCTPTVHFGPRSAGRAGFGEFFTGDPQPIISAQRLLDRGQNRLTIRMPALVFADLAQLRRRETAQPTGDLAGRQVVVAGDRERRAEADRPPRPVARAHESVDGLRPASAPRGRADLIAAATEQLLDVTEQIIGALAAAADEL
jgi:hypothetical protein